MVENPLVRSSSLRCYVLNVNKLRIKNGKKGLPAEKVAKMLIEESGDKLKNEFISI